MRSWLTKWLGNRGERLAAKFLRRQGLRILARQYSSPMGEIDLVALDGESIVFVEVKTRRSEAAGHPAEAVTLEKQKRLTRTALSYLKRYGLLERRARFDVVAILWSQEDSRPRVEHFRNAFPPVGSGQMFS